MSNEFPSVEVFKQVDTAPGGKKLFIVVSSDRGLCGGIHSSVTKTARKLITEGNEDAKVVVLGDKSRSQLTRLAADNLLLTFNQIGKDIPSFADACVIADFITKSDAEFDTVCCFMDIFVPNVTIFTGMRRVQQIRFRYQLPSCRYGSGESECPV